MNNCLWLSVRYSKTIQYGDRVHRIAVAGSSTAVFDPVGLWRRYVAAVPADPQDSAFVYHDTAGKLVSLDHASLVTGMKQLMAKIGVPAASISGHSLRRGGATYAYQSGVDGRSIKAQGDWSSECWMIYCDLGMSQKLGITLAMHKSFAAGSTEATIVWDPGEGA
jgi:integrase